MGLSAKSILEQLAFVLLSVAEDARDIETLSPEETDQLSVLIGRIEQDAADMKEMASQLCGGRASPAEHASSPPPKARRHEG